MKPIAFSCKATLSQTPEEVAEQILDVANWSDFQGYGPLPGIRSAEFEVRTPDVIGSRIRVTNRDGSNHIEEIVEWSPGHGLQLRFGEFSPPLSRLATGFLETWEFQRESSQTKVTRSFEITAKSILAWPVLWLISFLLRGAIARHLRQMGEKR